MARLATLKVDIPPMETLDSVPYTPREYILISVNSKGELDFLKGDYASVQEHLSRFLFANSWIKIMDQVAACDAAGSFTRFSTPENKTVLIFRNIVKRK